MSPREMRRAIYRLGAKAFKDRVKLAWAAAERTATYVQWRMLYVYADAWTPPPFPLDGAEIKAAGVPEGPLDGPASAARWRTGGSTSTSPMTRWPCWNG